MHYENGAVGRLWASSIDAGCMDSQRIRIVGSKASLVWSDANPSELRHEVQDQPNQTLYRGMPYLDKSCNDIERLGALHTEGPTES
jgi:predicted dehydrogenase